MITLKNFIDMLKIRLIGSEKVITKLVNKKKKLTNYREYFDDYATPALFKRFEEIFKKQGAVSNFSRWRRLRAATLAEKKRKGFRTEILRRTDRLLKAYTGKNSYGRIISNPRSLTYRNFVPYGIYHETGTSRGLPKRTIIARILAYKEFRNDLKNGLSKYLAED